MTSADFFYPGFEHAGLETPVDRALTWALCACALIAVRLRAGAGHVVERLSPRLQPQFDA